MLTSRDGAGRRHVFQSGEEQNNPDFHLQVHWIQKIYIYVKCIESLFIFTGKCLGGVL